MQQKQVKGTKAGKKEVQLFLLVESTRKLLKLTNKFCKVARYKINIQKLTVFLYNSNKQSEHEIKKIILLTIASKTINSRNKFDQVLWSVCILPKFIF